MDLVQGLACGNHSGDESLLLLLCSCLDGLSRGHGIVLLPLSGGNSDLLLIDEEVGCATRHDQ
jgi:hypothetical protein